MRQTYRELYLRSKIVAKAILRAGIEPGECIGIFASNCYEYIEVFLAGGRIGCPVVVLNATYTPKELLVAVEASGTADLVSSLSRHYRILIASCAHRMQDGLRDEDDRSEQRHHRALGISQFQHPNGAPVGHVLGEPQITARLAGLLVQ
jgi:acyl-CoA synthetase (AMP-forming)/AMP-acid ligase II